MQGNRDNWVTIVRGSNKTIAFCLRTLDVFIFHGSGTFRFPRYIGVTNAKLSGTCKGLARLTDTACVSFMASKPPAITSDRTKPSASRVHLYRPAGTFFLDYNIVLILPGEAARWSVHPRSPFSHTQQETFPIRPH